MPIVEVTLLEGRSSLTKDLLARQLADSVADLAGSRITGIHVLFHEMPHESWSRNLLLASNRPDKKIYSELERASYMSMARVPYDPATEVEYLVFRRDAINPILVQQPGFVSCQVFRETSAQSFLVIIKWLSKAHADAWAEAPGHHQIREQLKSLHLPVRKEPQVHAEVVHLDTLSNSPKA